MGKIKRKLESSEKRIAHLSQAVKTIEKMDEIHRSAVEEARKWLRGSRDERSKIAVEKERISELESRLEGLLQEMNVSKEIKEDFRMVFKDQTESIEEIVSAIEHLRHCWMNAYPTDRARVELREVIQA